MKNKVVRLDEAIGKINDGASIMVGGFLSVGAPLSIIDAILKKRVRGLTIIAN